MDQEKEQMILFWEDAEEAEQKVAEARGHLAHANSKGLPSANLALDLLQEAEAKIKEACKRVKHLLPGQNLDEAIDSIEQSGYSGFSIDQQNWYCVRHAIEVFFDGDFIPVKEYALGLTGNLITPKGVVVYGWKGQGDLFGVYCSVGNCPARVSQEEEE